MALEALSALQAQVLLAAHNSGALIAVGCSGLSGQVSHLLDSGEAATIGVSCGAGTTRVNGESATQGPMSPGELGLEGIAHRR